MPHFLVSAPPKPPKWVFTGPESAGKTTLAAALHHRLPGSALIEEYARPYLNRFPAGYAYTPQDVLHIAAGQRWLEQKAALSAPTALVCDTDLLTIYIWMQVKYGAAPHWLWHALQQSPADVYFLCAPDIPWEPDPLREAPDDHFRWHLFEIYENMLKKLSHKYIILEKDFENRFYMVGLHCGVGAMDPIKSTDNQGNKDR